MDPRLSPTDPPPPKTEASPALTTQLLQQMEAGDPQAAAEMLPLIYEELRALANRQFRGQNPNHTLQPTVLVHEAFLKVVGRPAADWKDRRHFFAVAATAMRQVLVSHARMKNAIKRGSSDTHITLHPDLTPAAGQSGPAQIDVLILSEALEQLGKADPRKQRLVELRFFAGLSMPEVAEVMDLSLSTVEAEWRAARAYLRVALS